MNYHRVTAVIVNWNNYSDTRNCIKSLQRLSYENLDIILIDNGSTDGSGKKLNAEFDNITADLLDENLGFPGGVNVGIRRALSRNADFVWLVNSDVRFKEDDTLSELVQRMQENPSVGILSPQINYYPETDAVWFDRGYVNQKTALTYTAEQYRWYLHGSKGQVRSQGLNDARLVSTDYVPFACSLIRTDLFEQIGDLDDGYFLYKEDVDFCLRAKDHGAAIATDQGICVYHRVSASSGGSYSPIHTYYNLRNRWLLAREHVSGGLQLFYLFYVFWVLILLVYLIVKWRPESIVALVRGVKDGISGKTGKGAYP